MSWSKYDEAILALTQEIEKSGDVAELYYQRGYLNFLANYDDLAKEDYKKAVSFGLDCTETPYYTFSNSNEKRRNFILPEKILVILILIVVCISLFYQVCMAIYKFKGLLG